MHVSRESVEVQILFILATLLAGILIANSTLNGYDFRHPRCFVRLSVNNDTIYVDVAYPLQSQYYYYYYYQDSLMPIHAIVLLEKVVKSSQSPETTLINVKSLKLKQSDTRSIVLHAPESGLYRVKIICWFGDKVPLLESVDKMNKNNKNIYIWAKNVYIGKKESKS